MPGPKKHKQNHRLWLLFLFEMLPQSSGFPDMNDLCGIPSRSFDWLALYEWGLKSMYSRELLIEQSLGTVNVVILQHFTINDCLLVILSQGYILHCNPCSTVNFYFRICDFCWNLQPIKIHNIILNLSISVTSITLRFQLCRCLFQSESSILQGAVVFCPQCPLGPVNT